MFFRNRFRMTISLLLCALLLLPLFAIGSRARAESEGGKDDRVIVVSLGDSYSSGEGIEPFYGYGESPVQEDWLAHRSIYAWSALLSHPKLGGALGIHRNTNWYFAASSGAKTTEIRRTGNVVDQRTGQREGEQKKEYGTFQSAYLPGQLDVFYNTSGLDREEVDYVTITIGGNDIGFVSVLEKAVQNHFFCSDLYQTIQNELDHFYDKNYKNAPGTYYKIFNAYRRIAEAAPNATILVAGYPELLDENGGAWLLFDKEDCAYINKAVRIFNSYLEALVRDCQRSGMKIEFCPVLNAFHGHQAYSNDPYLNPIYLGPFMQPQDLTTTGAVSAYSMHPNAKGARIYAQCVQRVIDELESGQKSPTGPERQTSEERDIVLVLDCSGSMDGTPMRETKKAAENFIRTILKEDASIGIVSYANYATMWSDFSRDETYLTDTVQNIYAYGRTNTSEGLSAAEEMLNSSTAKKKFIVLMSDGLPNEGKTGSELIEYAEQLREKGILIYTLGFFQSVDYWELGNAQNIMEEIASDACHFEVEDADDLVFFFEDIADQIRGTPYIYIRIACPVDVRVEYNGEVLSSTGNTRTSFGTVTFEEGQYGSYYWSGDNRTKILRLKEGADYKIQIDGNGEGTMDYTVSFVDEEGKYTDVREIKDVEVQKSSIMESNALRDKATVLKVDRDGDGKIDKTYSVGGPEKTEEPFPVWAWILIGVGGAILIAGAVFLVTVLVKKSASGGKGPSRGRVTEYEPFSNVEEPRTMRAETGVRFCPRCGRQVDSKSRFCAACSADLNPPKPGSDEKTSEPPVRTPPVPPKPMGQPEAGTELPIRDERPVERTSALPTEKPTPGSIDFTGRTSGGLRNTMRTKPTSTLFSKPEPVKAETPAEPQPTPPGAPEPVKAETPVEPESVREEPPVEAKPVIPVETQKAPPRRPSGPARICLYCGNPIEENARICLYCGNPAEQMHETEAAAQPNSPAESFEYCPHCGNLVEKGSRFCRHCGQQL